MLQFSKNSDNFITIKDYYDIFKNNNEEIKNVFGLYYKNENVFLCEFILKNRSISNSEIRYIIIKNIKNREPKSDLREQKMAKCELSKVMLILKEDDNEIINKIKKKDGLSDDDKKIINDNVTTLIDYFEDENEIVDSRVKYWKALRQTYERQMNTGGYKKWGKIENQKKIKIKDKIENTPYHKEKGSYSFYCSICGYEIKKKDEKETYEVDHIFNLVFNSLFQVNNSSYGFLNTHKTMQCTF